MTNWAWSSLTPFNRKQWEFWSMRNVLWAILSLALEIYLFIKINVLYASVCIIQNIPQTGCWRMMMMTVMTRPTKEREMLSMCSAGLQLYFIYNKKNCRERAKLLHTHTRNAHIHTQKHYHQTPGKERFCKWPRSAILHLKLGWETAETSHHHYLSSAKD